MATRTITRLVSDLTGDEIEDGKGETIDFTYRGTSYSIDLSDKEAAGFDKSIAMYLEHAIKQTNSRTRRSRSSSGSASTGATDYNAREVRTWARDQGIDVPDRGRIPAEVLEQYRQSS